MPGARHAPGRCRYRCRIPSTTEGRPAPQRAEFVSDVPLQLVDASLAVSGSAAQVRDREAHPVALPVLGSLVSMMVTCRSAISADTLTRPHRCSGTRSRHQRLMRSRSVSGIAIRPFCCPYPSVASKLCRIRSRRKPSGSIGAGLRPRLTWDQTTRQAARS